LISRACRCSRSEIDDAAKQREADAPLLAVTGHGGGFRIQANRGARALHEVAPSKLTVSPTLKSERHWRAGFRERCLVRIELDHRVGDPPVLGRAFGLHQELLGLELHDADASRSRLLASLAKALISYVAS
jgi:hypothetical protein